MIVIIVRLRNQPLHKPRTEAKLTTLEIVILVFAVAFGGPSTIAALGNLVADWKATIKGVSAHIAA